MIFHVSSKFIFRELCARAWSNHGNIFGKGSWEVDHSIPVSKNGTDHLNNLVPSCTYCNRQKGDMTGTQFKRLLIEDSEDPVTSMITGVIAGSTILMIGRVVASIFGDE